MSEISREEFQRLYDTIDDGFRGVHVRLDRMNGRIGTAETDIAVLQEKSSAARSAAWGGGIGGVMIGLVESVKWLMGR